MIPAQRFQTISKSQNIGLSAVASIKSSDVYNTVTNKLKEVSDDLKSTADSITQGILPKGVTIDDLDDKISGALREVKDTFSTLRDMSNVSVKDIEKSIASFLPDNPTIQNAFRSLTSACRDDAMSKAPSFKPIKDNAKCGSGNGKCSTGEVGGFFSKLTDGVIGTVAKAIQSLLNTLVMLGNLGYSASLCKIFATLTNNLPKGIIQRGAAALLASVGGSGNTTAVLDIAANMGTANPSKEVPGLVTRVASAFTIPDTFTSGTLDTLHEGYLTALAAIEPGFDKGAVDDTQSVAKLGETNESLAVVMTEFLNKKPVMDMQAPVDYEGLGLAAVYVTNGSVSVTSPSFFG